jgi:murein DD-endopeptidase MepM/ murein hydrolase activator NlpD
LTARIALALVVALPAAASPAEPSLALPIDCEIGRGCIVQNYVDRDPGPGARDYRCGLLTYDGHKGTDIRVIDRAAREKGVAVLAAAPGRVRAVRDGMPDASVRDAGEASVAGREAGNSVVIEHGDGWETQYAHLRRGRVAVRAGDVVKAGQRLGLVGLSGNTEFPHLHIEVRHRGRVVDPFVGEDDGAPCAQGKRPMWDTRALAALAYVASGLLDAGIAGGPPVLVEGNVDPERTERFDWRSSAVVFWIHVYGVHEGDIEELRLVAPDGRVLAQKRARIERNQAQWLTYVGKRRGEVWPEGIYRGEYALYRGSERTRVVAVVREARLTLSSVGRKRD